MNLAALPAPVMRSLDTLGLEFAGILVTHQRAAFQRRRDDGTAGCAALRQWKNEFR